MAISSIHIEPGRLGYFAHNSREQKTVNSIFDDEANYCNTTKKQAFELYRKELQIRSEAYTKKTKQKLQKTVVTHLSAIVNFNKEHTPDDIQKVCDYIEKKFDTKVIQFAMHKDEGHIDEYGQKVKNYHTHIEFMGLDSNGNSIRRKLDKPTLKELQTDVASILNMQRGRKSSYSKDEYISITNKIKKTDIKDKKDFNQKFNDVAKELGIYKGKKAKRLDTYEFKRTKEKESDFKKKIEKPLLFEINFLKEEVQKARKTMQENGAVREDYARLERWNKQLQEDLKNKNITLEKALKEVERIKDLAISQEKQLDNMQKKIDEDINYIDSLLLRIEELEQNVSVLQKEINHPNHKTDAGRTLTNKEVADYFEHITIPELQQEVEKLQQENKDLKTENNSNTNKDIMELQALKVKNQLLEIDKKELQTENKELKEKISGYISTISTVLSKIVEKNISHHFFGLKEFYGELQIKKAIKQQEEEENKKQVKQSYEDKPVQWVDVSLHR